MQAFATADKSIVWKGIRVSIIEHCTITRHADLTVINGHISGSMEEQPVNIDYEITLDDSYDIKSVLVKSFYGDSFELNLVQNNKKWFDSSGNHLIEFDGCDDIDIALTPFTNSIPINRLHLKPGDYRNINVIYIDPEQKSITKVQQRYTHIESKKYRYENLCSGFISDVYVDSDGIVVHYPGLWERIDPKNPAADSKTTWL